MSFCFYSTVKLLSMDNAQCRISFFSFVYVDAKKYVKKLQWWIFKFVLVFKKTCVEKIDLLLKIGSVSECAFKEITEDKN